MKTQGNQIKRHWRAKGIEVSLKLKPEIRYTLDRRIADSVFIKAYDTLPSLQAFRDYLECSE